MTYQKKALLDYCYQRQPKSHETKITLLMVDVFLEKDRLHVQFLPRGKTFYSEGHSRIVFGSSESVLSVLN